VTEIDTRDSVHRPTTKSSRIHSRKARSSSIRMLRESSWRPVVAQCPRDVIPFHVLFQRYRCECPPGPQQVVSTAVAWRVCYQGATVRRGGL
jgi:hypothetical protein